MLTLLTYVFGLLLVGGLLFLAASFAFGRGEEMAPALPEGTPVELPDDRPAAGADLRALKLSVVVRGYRMEEVDWLLERLAEQVDSRDREIARLQSVLHVEPVGVGARTDTPVRDNGSHAAEPALLTHPVGPAAPSARSDGAGPGDAWRTDPGPRPRVPEEGARQVAAHARPPDPESRLDPGETGEPDLAYLPDSEAEPRVPPEPVAGNTAELGPDQAYLDGSAEPVGSERAAGGAADPVPDPAYLDDPEMEPPARSGRVPGGVPEPGPDLAYLDDPAEPPVPSERVAGGVPEPGPDLAYLDDPAEPPADPGPAGTERR